MKQIIQDPRDCVLCHFWGEEATTFDPSKLDRKKVEHHRLTGNVNLEVAIIGESHYIVIRRCGRPEWIELLACVDPVELGFIPNEIRRLHSGREHTLKMGDFQFFAVTDIMPPNDDRSYYYPRDNGNEIVRLSLAFPGKLAPRTEVLVEEHASYGGGCSLAIRTLHEYEGNGHIEPLVSMTMVQVRLL